MLCNLTKFLLQNQERRERWQRLEETLKDDAIPEDQKAEKRQQHASKETEFLRLKRSKLGVEDFDPLKVSENIIILEFIQKFIQKKSNSRPIKTAKNDPVVKFDFLVP